MKKEKKNEEEKKKQGNMDINNDLLGKKRAGKVKLERRKIKLSIKRSVQ